MTAGTTDPVAVACRFCRSHAGELVLDMGRQPACDHFPEATDSAADPIFPIRLWLCADCGLAQLVEDPTVPEEVRGVEPQALIDQAHDAVALAAAAGLLPRGARVVEFGSPHGGSWLGILGGRGLRVADGGRADVVLDCFGLMHDGDLATAVRRRIGMLEPDGVLLLQFHSLAAVIEHGQWNAVRHGHPVYLSVPSVVEILDRIGLTTVHGWHFDLYGGTVLLAARRGGTPDPSVHALVEAEIRWGVRDPAVLGRLGEAAASSAAALREWLVTARAAGRTVLGYGAASRAVPLLNHAGIGPDLLAGVADASAAKVGRRVPGVRIPIISPDDLAARSPDEVILFVPDLLDEVRRALPDLEAAGTTWVVAEPRPRAVQPAG